TDIIVGFPGETYEDFSQTLELIKKVRFDSLFSFIYSKRVGTKAALMEDNISDAEKSKWFQELLQTQRAIGRQVYSSCVGKTYKVLVEGHGKEGGLTGRNEQYMIVNFDGDDSYIGNFVNIKITKALNWALEGELV
ncbi:MAG: TRAM domain-containing protein, partial [Oscillospiraceae bacterium]